MVAGEIAAPCSGGSSLILVSTPMIRKPNGLISLPARRTGEWAKSTSAAHTARTVFGSLMYFSHKTANFSSRGVGTERDLDITREVDRSARELYIRRSVGSLDTVSSEGMARSRSVRVRWILGESVNFTRAGGRSAFLLGSGCVDESEFNTSLCHPVVSSCV